MDCSDDGLVIHSTSETEDHNDLGRHFVVEHPDEKNITNVTRIFLSQPTLNASSKHKHGHVGKVMSEPNWHYKVNYDNLCGPWDYGPIPIYQRYDQHLTPQLFSGILINENDIKGYQNNRDKIIDFIKDKLPDGKIFSDVKNKRLFLKLMRQVLTFTRDNCFNEKGVSTSLNLFFLTHRFFLSQAQRTPAETCSFFYQSLLLHCSMDPPKSDLVFSQRECNVLFKFFWTSYLQQLPLIRLACLPNYKLILNLKSNHTDYDNSIKM